MTKTIASPTRQTELPPLLYVEDLARLLRIKEPAVRKRLRLGQLGLAGKMCGKWYVRRAAFLHYLEEGERADF